MATPPTLSVAMRMTIKIRNQMAGDFVRTLLRLKSFARRELQVSGCRSAVSLVCLQSQVHTAVAWV